MSTTPSAPEAGTVLAGKYLVEEVLGVGGMGVVVAAKHLQLDQRVAIKYLLPAALLNPEVVERFAREARAAAKIRGEHVARVIDVGQFDDGAPFMVLEYLEGHDLAKHLELHGPLPIEDAMLFILETCEALAEAHAAKIVHRDLKPNNLFLARQPDKSTIIKVLDFGISKTGDAPSASLTKTSALMGTAFYMSPEQLTNPKGVDHRSDIWSLGVILYELLSGRQPFQGETVPEIIGGILQNEPEGLRTLRPEVPLDLELVIAKCMQSKPAQRYASVAGLAAALGPFANASDRRSIEIIARVLGESLKPAPVQEAGNATLIVKGVAPASVPEMAAAPSLSSGAAPATAVSASAASSASPASSVSAAGGQRAGEVAGAVTGLGLSASSITPKAGSKRGHGMGVWVAGLGAAAVLGALVFFVSAKRGEGDRTPTAGGIVAAPPPTMAEVPAASTASGAASPNMAAPGMGASGSSVSAGVLGAASATAAPNASAAIAVQPAAAAGTRTSNGRVVTPSAAKPAAAAPPAASAATAATPPAATPPVAMPPAASAPKNPLQMGIK